MKPRREERVDDRVDVDQPEPERDRDHVLEDLFHRRVAPVEREPQPAVEAAQPRQRQEHLDERRDQNRDRVHVELRVHRVRLRDADRESDDDRDVPEHRRDRRHREVVVAVEDPDDHAADAEQGDDRKEHAREADSERAIVARVAEDADHPRRDEDEERAERCEAEQHQPEEARRDAPGSLRIVLQQVDEDRDERGRERRIRDERAYEVRQLERNGERVDRATRTEVIRGDDLAHEPEHAGEPGRSRRRWPSRLRVAAAAARRRARAARTVPSRDRGRPAGG